MAEVLTQGKRTGVHVANNPVPAVYRFDYGSVPDAGVFTRVNSADSAQVTVASDQLRITHSATSGYNGCDTLLSFDLTGMNTYIEVVDAGNQTIVSHGAILKVYLDSNNTMFMTALNGNMRFYKVVAGVQTQVGSNITYNTTNHRWWRIRESGGTVFIDMSPNGQDWTNGWSLANPFAVTALYLAAQSGCYANESGGSYTYFDNWYFPLSSTNLSTFMANSGTKPEIIQIYQHWEQTDSQSAFMQGWFNAIDGQGATPMLTWEPWNRANGATQATFQLIDIINGDYDSYITTFATACAAWGKPFYLRFAHEMNGTWYPWAESVNSNSAGQYATAWQHVYNIFHPICANAIWIWAPNINFSGSTAISGLYPGDAYVDWIGIDCYNLGTDGGNTWTTFTSLMTTTYSDIAAVNTTKPMMLSEVGCSENGGSKSAWIADMYKTSIETFPRIKTIVWYNASFTPSDTRIETSASAQESFKQSVKYWLTRGKVGNLGRAIKVSSGMGRSEGAT